MKRLNLGSGKSSQVPDAVTIDRNSAAGADITHDLNVYPWPLPAEQFDEIYCYDILEHLDDIVSAMQEIYRVSANYAKIIITTPHFSCRNAFTDPTHKHYFGIHSFDYFLEDASNGFTKWSYYSSARFKLIHRKIHFERNWPNKLVWRITEKFPDLWESRLCWIFPAWFMDIELRTLKPVEQ